MPHDRENQLELARKRAKENLPRLDRLYEWIKNRRAGEDDARRAFIIEFAGMPKAGKSGCIKTIRQYFSSGSKIRVKEAPGVLKRPYRIYTPAEGVSLRTPGLLKQNPLDYNSWAGAYALQELLQARHDNYHDIVILDRGPWDAGCWLEHVKTIPLDHPITSQEADKIVGFFQLPHWMICADLHVVLVVDPTKAAEREHDERLITHHGPASDKVLMAAIKKIYERKFPSLQDTKTKHCPHVGSASALLIDTTDKAPLEVAAEVIDGALKVIDLKIDARATITEDEVWAAIASFVTRTARRDQVSAVREFLPRYVEKARQYGPAVHARLRANLTELHFPMTDGVDLFSNRYEASYIIGELNRLLESAVNEG
jgi:hypothetical protein